MKLLLADHTVPVRTELGDLAAVKGWINSDYPEAGEWLYLYNMSGNRQITVKILPGYLLADRKTNIFDYLESTGDFIHIIGEARVFPGIPEHFAISVHPDKLTTLNQKPLMRALNPSMKSIEFVLGDHKIPIFLTAEQARKVDARIEAMQQVLREKNERKQYIDEQKNTGWVDRSATAPGNEKTGGTGRG